MGGKTNENGFNIKEVKQNDVKAKQSQIKMEYFVDCREGTDFDEGIKSPPKKRVLGSS